jgi:hypothetical protein
MEPKAGQIEGEDPFEGTAAFCMQRPDEGGEIIHLIGLMNEF